MDHFSSYNQIVDIEKFSWNYWKLLADMSLICGSMDFCRLYFQYFYFHKSKNGSMTTLVKPILLKNLRRFISNMGQLHASYVFNYFCITFTQSFHEIITYSHIVIQVLHSECISDISVSSRIYMSGNRDILSVWCLEDDVRVS